MRAFRIFVVVAILLISSRGIAVVSDPNELVENSRVESQTQAVWRQVTTKVTGWLNEAADMITPPAPTETKPIASGTTSTATPTANAPATVASTALPAGPVPTSGLGQMNPAATPAQTASSPAAVAVAPTAEEQIEKLKQNLPGATNADKVTAHDLIDARKQLHTQGAAAVAKPGRKGTSNLKLSKAGVPLFPLEVKQSVKLGNGKTKVVMAPLKKIPRLDIGEERTLGRNRFLPEDFKLPLADVRDVPQLPSPDLMFDSRLMALISLKVVPAGSALDLDQSKMGIDKVVSHHSLSQIRPNVTEPSKVIERPYAEMTEAQLKMLTGLILYAKGDRCHTLLGLFDTLSKNDKLSSEANFHLGLCALKMKMQSLAFDRLSSLVRSENREFGGDALTALVDHLPAEYELRFAKLVRNLKDMHLVNEKIKDEVNYLTAKGSFKEGDYASSRTYAERVSESSPRFGNSAYLIGLSWYSMGNSMKAMSKLEGLRQWLADKKMTDKNLNSLTAINLARMKFTQGKYKEALGLYAAIDKDHPMWVQGLIEQGWAQLAVEDYAGAIGNMYSLHSPYFKAVYKPESFAVRTIGYLNICQYGDAYKTLSWLENEYRPWTESVAGYVTERKLASQYYDTTIGYLRGGSTDNVDGLPAQVIREMARQKVFLNHQASINDKADEVSRYDGLEKIIRDEKGSLLARIKKATLRFKDLDAKLAKAAKDKTLAETATEWKRQSKLERDLIVALRYQVEVLDMSRMAWTALRTESLERIDKERYVLREAAARNLVETLTQIKGNMAMVLENNELLRYEVFAGSGENIRYQVAGGEITEANRIPASVKPTKMMNWNFDGEYWEDEIGAYRSSLQNNCPAAGKMDEFFKAQNQAPEPDKEAGQAALEKGAGR